MRSCGDGADVRPRVLFISCHLPLPAISGGRRRELELIRRVSGQFDIHLVVVSKTPAEDLRHVAEMLRYCTAIEVFAAEPGPADQRAAGEAVQVARHRCPAATERIGRILADERTDIVHVEGFYLMQHVPELSTAPLLLVEQNVEYELQRQRARTRQRAADLEAFGSFTRTRAAEQSCWRRADVVAAVTDEDALTISDALPGTECRVIPDGADHVPNLRLLDGGRRVERPDAPLIALPANFAYAPNVDAACHLHDAILPRLRARVPGVHTWLVGNAPPRELRALESDTVTVTGRVPELMSYLDAADVVVCPLRIGGGIKVKAIEALRRGKAMVSTPLGVQGLPPRAREAIRVATDAREFADQTAELLLNGGRRAELERLAHRAGALLPSWDAAAAELADTYDALLRRASAGPVAAATVTTGGSA